MIYLFDKEMKLNKSLPLNHFESAHQVHIVNGSYTLDLVTPLKFTKRGTVYNHKKAFDKAVFAGVFDEHDKFQLYKLRTIAVDNNNLNIIGIHKFFDEAEAKAIIHDRRWRDSELRPIAEFALGEIGWNLIECDVTDRYNFNLFRASILDFRKDAVDTYKVEMDFEIGFDGQKITSKGVRIKNRLGEETGARHAYGSNVLKITAEEERSEVFSAVIGRGRGEESGDGFGQRIEFDNVVWSTANGDPVNKPAGQNYVELESATEKHGYYDSDGTVRPRIAVVEFDDIEDPNILIKDSWDWLLQNSVPKAVFESKVFSLGKYNLGDSIGIIYKDAGIVKKARIHKIDRNLKDDRLTQYELGDYKHFKPETIGDVRGELKKQQRATSEWITRLKRMFDEDFDRVVGEINDGYLNAVAEAEAKVQASEAKMNEVISGQRQEMTQKIQTAEENAIQQATQNAETKKQEVLGSLNEFKNVHQQLYDSVTADIMNIDEFLGDISNITLDERLQEMNLDFEDRIRNININTANMLQGTRFDEPDKINTSLGGAEILTTSDINRIRIRDDTGYVSRFAFEEPVKLEANTDYFVTIEYRTFTVPEIDYFAIETPTGYVRLNSPDTGKEGFNNLVTDGVWNQATIRLNEPVMLQGKLHIGTRPGGVNNGAWIDVRQPYMTNTSNRRWLPHPNDATQSIEQISRRITELEDGRTELITRSEYDFDTGQVDQTIRNIEERVDVSRNMIVDIQNYDVIKNGSEVMQTVDGFNQKVWISDVANIGANLLPQSSGAWEDGGLWIEGGGESPNSNNIRMVENRTVKSSTDYTISDYSKYVSAIQNIDIHEYTANGTHMGYHRISRGGEKTFTTHWNTTNVRVSLLAMDGFSIGTHFIEHLDGRIKVKLEEGSESTAMVNAISHLQQIADKISLKVQELSSSNGEDILTHSDISVQADRVLIGSQSIGASTLASIISVSPTAVDIITDELNLTGNLNVKGQIETISLDAIDANFARVQTAVLTSDVITSDMIGSNVIRAEHIFVQNAMIEDIVNTNLFTDTVNTMSINAVYADLRSVTSEIMQSNIIKSEWLDVDTALFNRFTASSAFITSLTSKEVFARDINAIEVRANSQILQTMMNRFGEVEGGQRILGYDGRVVIDNGILQNTFDINFIQPGFMGVGVDTSANYYRTKNTSYSNGTAFSYKQAGRYLVVEGYCEIRANTAGTSRDTIGAIRLMEYSGGTRSSFVYIGSRNDNNDDNQYFKIELDLGVPGYNQRNFYVQFYVANAESDALFRINQAYQYH